MACIETSTTTAVTYAGAAVDSLKVPLELLAFAHEHTVSVHEEVVVKAARRTLIQTWNGDDDGGGVDDRHPCELE